MVLPTSVPLSTVNKPLGFTVNGPYSESVWLLSESVTMPAPLVPRMIAPTPVAPLSETITPALVMMAVSFVPGTVFGFQLAAVFHPPLAALVQLMVVARTEKLARKRKAVTVAATTRWVENRFFIDLQCHLFIFPSRAEAPGTKVQCKQAREPTAWG